jgi:hypothetical protein
LSSGGIVNRLTVIFLCLMLCLAGTMASTDVGVSAVDTVANSVIVMTIGSKILKVDDVDREIDAGPQIRWGRTFSPIAPIISALGGTIEWDAMTCRVTIILGAKTIVLTIGSRYAVVNGKSVSIDSNPDLVPYVQAPGRTMLPVRFVAEQFGALVTWDSTLQHVTLALKVTSPPLPLTHRVVSFTTNDTKSTFLTLLADESVDVIEMVAGTYHLPYTVINIDRTRPVVVRPAAGATVVLSGANIGTDPQFWFGLNGRAGNITMQGLIFDGFVLGQQGIVQALDCHDITLNDMVVRNSRCNGTWAKPYHAWAIYLSATPTVVPTNFTANRWTVDGSARQMGALQVYGGSHVTATGWSVSNAYYAVYASGTEGPLTDFVLDGWTISNTGAPAWGAANASVYVEYASGRFSNMRGTASGVLVNVGTPKLTDGGGNSL